MAELLDRILDFDNVKLAWEHSAGKGKTPGVDDWSLRRFGRGWEENLRALIADVRANRYQPKRLRVRYVPKRGSVGDWEPSRRDRPQRASTTARTNDRTISRKYDRTKDYVPCLRSTSPSLALGSRRNITRSW
jgi:hypothetical protein